jgi:expansin (peptidoglycan-binding protein)
LSKEPDVPDVTGIEPRIVDGTAGGESIVVTGSGLADVTQVWFGEVAATTFTIDSDEQITAVNPAQNLTPSSNVPVEVEGPAGRSVPGPVDSAYLTLGRAPEAAPVGALPVVASIHPTFVDGTGGGDLITITGSGFSAPVQVWFGSEAGLEVSIDSDTQITATTPVQNMTPSSMIAVLVDAAGGRSVPGPVDSAYLTLGNPPA